MPWEPLKGETDDDPTPVTRGLDQVLRTLGAPTTGAVGTIFDRWEELMGAQIAARARPLSLRNGTLVIAVEDPAWATELRFLEVDLLVRISTALGAGTVNAIELRVRPSRAKN